MAHQTSAADWEDSSLLTLFRSPFLIPSVLFHTLLFLLALRAATLEGAYLTFEEDLKGSLEPGKLADMAVLSADPLTCAEKRIKDITAELTIVGGRVVHST